MCSGVALPLLLHVAYKVLNYRNNSSSNKSMLAKCKNTDIPLKQSWELQFCEYGNAVTLLTWQTCKGVKLLFFLMCYQHGWVLTWSQ